MVTRRLLFARSGLAAGVAAVYVALLSIACVSLVGFAVAAWPGEPDAFLSCPAGAAFEAAPASRPFHGVLPAQPAASGPRVRRTWT